MLTEPEVTDPGSLFAAESRSGKLLNRESAATTSAIGIGIFER
jgi:hypothetical protein